MAMFSRSSPRAILAVIGTPLAARQRPMGRTTTGPVRGITDAGIAAFECAARATGISLFGAADVKYGAATVATATATDCAAAAPASDRLAAFVKSGDPAIGGGPVRPRYHTDAARMLDLDVAGGAAIVAAD